MSQIKSEIKEEKRALQMRRCSGCGSSMLLSPKFFKVNRKGEYNKTCLSCSRTRKIKRDLRNASNLNKLLIDIAKMCIKNNYHRELFPKESLGYDLTFSELSELQAKFRCYVGGYCFLDEDGGDEGMIRLYTKNSNPKWSFFRNGEGEIEVTKA